VKNVFQIRKKTADGQIDVKEELEMNIDVDVVSCSPRNNEKKESR
jgi:hypothetical protein